MSYVIVTNCHIFMWHSDTGHITQSQVITTQSYVIEEYKRFQNNDIILYVFRVG